MATICSRRDKSLQSPSELDEKELYYATPREYLVYVGHPSLSKKASDAWEHKKSVDTIKTYADHFEYKNAGLRVRRDFQMGTMKVTKRPRLNYLKVPPALNRKETIALNQTETYYPIEVLRYASLNRADFDLIHKLPSVLLRLTQLYHAQRLQQLFGENIRCYSVEWNRQSRIYRQFLVVATRQSQNNTDHVCRLHEKRLFNSESSTTDDGHRCCSFVDRLDRVRCRLPA